MLDLITLSNLIPVDVKKRKEGKMKKIDPNLKKEKD